MAFAELHAHTMMSNLKAGRDSVNYHAPKGTWLPLNSLPD